MSLTRRRFLASAATFASSLQLRNVAHAMGFESKQAAVCLLAAEQVVGPYYVADEMLRSNIREGKPGVPLHLRIAVVDVHTCQPLPDAAIDVWHCDALGIYSGYTKENPDEGPGGPGGPMGPPPTGADGKPMHPPTDKDGKPLPPPNWAQGSQNGPPQGPPPGANGGPPPAPKPTDKLTFLRGIQLTGKGGAARFETIYPGFYAGRTNHVHFSVRLGGHTAARDGAGRTYAGGHTSHVGQIFFSEALNDELMKLEPYRSHNVQRTTNHTDGIFQSQQGELSTASVVWLKRGDPAAGLRAEIIVAVDPKATPKAADFGGGPGGFGPPPSAGEAQGQKNASGSAKETNSAADSTSKQ